MSRRPRARIPEPLPREAIRSESALGRLLTDASAPAHPHELEGLSAALTAFDSHRPNLRRSRMKSVLAKLLAVKALAATGAVSVGGVALAAATGALPPTIQNTAHDVFGAPAASSTTDPSTDPAEPTSDVTPTPTPSVEVTPGAAPSTAAAKPSATPSPSLIGLCHAYGAGVANAHGKALDNPAFTVLITAAGGKDGVTAYCTTLLATAPGGKPSSLPTAASDHKSAGHKPAGHPTGAPATHPTGAPATHPGGASENHPTGKP